MDRERPHSRIAAASSPLACCACSALGVGICYPATTRCHAPRDRRADSTRPGLGDPFRHGRFLGPGYRRRDRAACPARERSRDRDAVPGVRHRPPAHQPDRRHPGLSADRVCSAVGALPAEPHRRQSLSTGFGGATAQNGHHSGLRPNRRIIRVGVGGAHPPCARYCPVTHH
jgi:hypothetical protein